MTNFYQGLARGPIDHESSSVINSISNGTITMGSCVVVVSPATSAELLARVIENPSLGIATKLYGIAVAGDVDGVYGDGNEAFTDVNRATNAPDQGVVIVTQGRCLARVESTVAIAIGDPLSSSAAGGGNEGVLINQLTNPSSPILARALQPLSASPGFHIIAVDVQREVSSAEATMGLIQVDVPKMTIQSSSTDSGDLYGNFPQGAQNPYSFPFPGTITKVVINTLSGGPNLGGGFFELIKKPLSGTGTTPLGQLPLASAFGVDVHIVSYAFVANDGFQFHIQANNVGALFNFFLEVEYDLI